MSKLLEVSSHPTCRVLQAEGFNEKQQAAVSSWLGECEHFLGEGDTPTEDAPPAQHQQQSRPYLFQGQLSVSAFLMHG